MQKMNKTKTSVLIILLSILCIILIGLMIAFISGVIPIWKFNIDNDKVSKHLVYEKVYNSELQSIDIDIMLGNVEVLPSSDDNIHLSIYSDYELYEVSDTSSSLVVNFQEEEGFHFNFSKVGDKVEIYIPEDSGISFDISVDKGAVEVGNFLNSSFDITADMGDVDVDGGKFIDVNSDMGDIFIGKVSRLNAELDLGDLEVETVTEAVDISCDMGNVSINEVHLLKDSAITLSLGDLDINNLSGVYVDAKTDLGDVDVKDNNRNASYTLTIKNDMGDISIG